MQDTCLQCKQPYEVTTPETLRSPFCSQDCHKLAYEATNCFTCSEPISLSKRSWLFPGFCGKPCQPRPPCVVCHKLVYIPRTAKRYTSKFCSQECKQTAKGQRAEASRETYHTAAVVAFAETLRQTGSIKCDFCGESELILLGPCYLNGKSSDHSPENLCTICASCYRRATYNGTERREVQTQEAIDLLAQNRLMPLSVKQFDIRGIRMGLFLTKMRESYTGTEREWIVPDLG